MKTRALIAFVISAVLAGSLFAACGSSESTGTASGSAGTVSGSSGGSGAGPEETASSSSADSAESSSVYLQAASGIVSQAKEICISGAETADALRQAASDFYMLVMNPDAVIETPIASEADFISYMLERMDESTADRETLSSILSQLDSVSVNGNNAAGEIKSSLKTVLTEMEATYTDMESLVSFYQESNGYYNDLLLNAVNTSDYSDPAEYLNQINSALTDLQAAYRNMEKPPQLTEIWNRNAENISLFASSLNFLSYYNATNGASMYYSSFNEMNEYNSIVEQEYSKQLIAVMSASFEKDREMFGETYPAVFADLETCIDSGRAPSDAPEAEAQFEYDFITEIYPNRYPTQDSVINLTASTNVEKQDVMISVEIPGFTQAYEQKATLTQQVSYFMIKPPLLTELPDLSTRRDTQLIFKITDNDTGKVLVQESKSLTLYSIFDFFIYTDEFGTASIFDLFGWLRPESDAVDAVNRQAISYLESVTGEGLLTGYNPSYSENPDVNTLVQVAAIQKAISDLGIRYTMDAYSFSGAQHILTPDEVVARKTGLCIESSLLMASCLMKAELHPIIILTPGHAQVAVESYVGTDGRSGQYYLIETTDIPYGGFTVTENGVDFGDLVVNPTDPSSSWWDEYLSANQTEDGFPFVLDCDLRSVMHIQGLENIQASINIEPIIYENVELPPEDGTQEESGSADASSEYTYVSNGNQDLAIAVRTSAKTDATDSVIYVYPVAGSELPVLHAARVYNTDAAAFLNDWIDDLKNNDMVINVPAEISSMSYDSLTLSYIDYMTTDDNTVYYENFVAALSLEDGSLVIFELIADENDAAGINALNDAFTVALATFQ